MKRPKRSSSARAARGLTRASVGNPDRERDVLDLPVVTIATISGMMSSFRLPAFCLHVFLAPGLGSLTVERVDG
jgi:hypothetical protein